MTAKKIYPEWVQKQRTKGTTVKKVGENYYLYRHSSKRVPGKKNPVPVDTYIGRITPTGVEKGRRKKIASGEVEVREFGFSRAVEQLCPQGWKDAYGKDWESLLDYIIVKESPESYILKERTVVDKLDPHTQYGAQKSSLMRRMEDEYHVKLDDLRKGLSNIYLVYIGGRKLVSKLSDEQRALTERLSLKLEAD